MRGEGKRGLRRARALRCARTGHQVAVELRDDDVALAELAEYPGLGLEEGALAQAEEDADDDARRRLHEDARRRDGQHDHEVALRAPGGGGGSDRPHAGRREGAAAHRVVVDVHDLVDLDHPDRDVDEDGRDVGQGQELEVGEKDKREGHNCEGAYDAGDSGCGTALDVQGRPGQCRRGRNASEKTCDQVGQGYREYLLPLIEFCFGHAISDSAAGIIIRKIGANEMILSIVCMGRAHLAEMRVSKMATKVMESAFKNNE